VDSARNEIRRQLQEDNYKKTAIKDRYEMIAVKEDNYKNKYRKKGQVKCQI